MPTCGRETVEETSEGRTAGVACGLPCLSPDDLLGLTPEEVASRYPELFSQEDGVFATLAIHFMSTARDLRGIAMSNFQNAGKGSMAALRCLAATDKSLTPTEIAEAVRITGARVTTILNTLEERGLVVRERSTVDRRRIEVTITDAGRTAIHDVNENMLHFAMGFLRDLGEQDATDLVRLMGRVSEVIQRRSEVAARPSRPSDDERGGVRE